MNALEFVSNYEYYIDEISNVIKPELKSIIIKLKERDPHDLVTPEAYFNTEQEARGYVFAMFMKQVRIHQSLMLSKKEI